MRDKINELQRMGMLAVYNFSEMKGEKIQKVINMLIDWLLYNLDEIKKYIKEMDYLGAGTVYGDGIVNEETDLLERDIIEIEEAKQIIKSVEDSIKSLDDQAFYIYIDRYHSNLKYSEIADFEGISEITVKREIKKIRKEVEDGFSRDDITFDSILALRKKLRGIRLKKVS